MSQDSDEYIQLESHNPAWLRLAANERAALIGATGSTPEKVQHIGSTAVPGLLAKPILDLLFGTDAYPPPEQLVEQICSLGFQCIGEYGLPGRLYFRKRGEVAVNLHVMLFGCERWLNNLAFRDHLLHSKAARHRYAAAKLAARDSGANTPLAYSEAKASTVQALLADALARRNDA